MSEQVEPKPQMIIRIKVWTDRLPVATFHDVQGPVGLGMLARTTMAIRRAYEQVRGELRREALAKLRAEGGYPKEVKELGKDKVEKKEERVNA